jgi:hypothetical protein
LSVVLAATLLAAPLTQAPRLELGLVKLREPASPQSYAEIQLTILNSGSAPVEARTGEGIVPKLFGPDGKQVVLSDWRDLAGAAPPGLPAPPQAPVRPGERRLLQTYRLARTPSGYQFIGPYGGAPLTAGRYRVEVALDLSPQTREQWVAEHMAAVRRPGGQPKDPKAAAEHEADQYAAHWREVPGFFRGHLDAPPLEVVLP